MGSDNESFTSALGGHLYNITILCGTMLHLAKLSLDDRKGYWQYTPKNKF